MRGISASAFPHIWKEKQSLKSIKNVHPYIKIFSHSLHSLSLSSSSFSQKLVFLLLHGWEGEAREEITTTKTSWMDVVIQYWRYQRNLLFIFAGKNDFDLGQQVNTAAKWQTWRFSLKADKNQKKRSINNEWMMIHSWLKGN